MEWEIPKPKEMSTSIRHGLQDFSGHPIITDSQETANYHGHHSGTLRPQER